MIVKGEQCEWLTHAPQKNGGEMMKIAGTIKNKIAQSRFSLSGEFFDNAGRTGET